MKLLITRLLSASLFISSVACEEEFSPRSSLEGLRVLAIVTDPIEASVVDPRPMTLSPFVVSTSSITLKHEWTFCPISLGGRAGYACAIPECEVQIPSDTGVIQFHPGQSAGKCLESLSSRTAGNAPGGFDDSTELPDTVETIFRYTVSNPAGNSVDSIARVPLWIAGPAENPNKAITIKQVEINGAITSSVATPILVDALDSISIKVDLDEAMIETEDDPLISFFATEGRFEAERVLGTTATNELNIKDTSVTEVEIYVVARDGRGSQAVFGGIVVKKQL